MSGRLSRRERHAVRTERVNSRARARVDGDLPMPGPGRPHHRSYTEPGSGGSVAELLILVVGLPSIVFLWSIVGGLIGG